METNRSPLPFAMYAARASVLLPLGVFVVNFFTRALSLGRYGNLALGSIFMLAYITGLVLSIIALMGIKKHGPTGIRGYAIAGLIINSIIILLAIILIPAMLKVKNHTENINRLQKGFETFSADMQEDLIQLQTSAFVPTRTYTVEEHGKGAPMMQAVNDQIVAQAMAMRQFNQKNEHIDIGFCLQPDQLIDPNSIERSRQQILLLQRSYQEFVKKIENAADICTNKVRTLDIPQNMKEGFLEGYIEGLNREGNMLETLKKVHFDYTQAIIGLLSYMEQISKECFVEDGILYFEQDADMIQYNQIFNHIIELEEKLQNVSVQAQQKGQELIKEGWESTNSGK